MISLCDFTHPWQRSCHCRHVVKSSRKRTSHFPNHLFHQETNVSVETVIQSLPASDAQLEKIKQEQDDVCKQIKEYCMSIQLASKTQTIRSYTPMLPSTSYLRSQLRMVYSFEETDSSFRHPCDWRSLLKFTQAIKVSLSLDNKLPD